MSSTRLTHDLVVSDPNAAPEALRYLARHATGVRVATRIALAAHPNLPPDFDVVPTLLAGSDPATRVHSMLSARQASAQRRAQVLAGADTADLWQAISEGAPMTSTELRAARDQLPRVICDGTRRRHVASALLAHPDTPSDLAHDAASDLAAHPNVNLTGTALLLVAAAGRHRIDPATLPATGELSAILTALTEQLRQDADLADLISAHATELPNATWPQLLRAHPDEKVARAALATANTSGRQNAVINSAALPDTVRLEAAVAFAANAFNASHISRVDDRTRWGSAIVDFARTTTSAHTLLELLRMFSTDARTASVGRGRVLAAAVVDAAVTNPHLTAEHSAEALDAVRGAPHRDFVAALAAQPGTPPHVRTDALTATGNLSTPTVHVVAHRLAAGSASPAGDVDVRALTNDATGGRSMRPAARMSAHNHRSWPPSRAMVEAMLTLEPGHRGTLRQLLETAHAITT